MPLTTLPDQGIEIPLSEYNRLRAFQGGGWFWDHDNQQVIRRELGDFLPRVEARLDRGNALFQHFVGTTEALSRSQAVGAQMARVPRAEYQRLQRALENLKLKAQDPRTEPDARKVIEKFRLPDPAKDPDLYRLYGSGWNRRLLVLWGCEREEGTSLEPVAALHKVAVESSATTLMRRLLMLLPLLLLLLLLLGAGFWWWRQHEEEERRRNSALTSDPPAVTTTMAGTSAAARDVRAGAVNPVGPVGAPFATPGDTTAPPDQAGAAADASDASKAAEVAKSGQTQNALTGSNNAGAMNRTASAASMASKQGQGASGDTATKTDEARSASEQNRANGETGAAAGAEKGVQPPVPTDLTAPPSPMNPPATGAENPPVAGPAKAGPPAAPPKVEILKAQSPSTPHDGKMDAVLMATAHEDDGTMTPLEVTRWSVDDRPQQDSDGHDVTTGQLRLSLTPGKHRVSVSGKAHGVAVEADTDMDVEIKSQGDVTLKPRQNK